MSHRTDMQQQVRMFLSDTGFDAYVTSGINSCDYGRSGTMADSKLLGVTILREAQRIGLGTRWQHSRDFIINRFFDGVCPIAAGAQQAPAPVTAVPPGLTEKVEDEDFDDADSADPEAAAEARAVQPAEPATDDPLEAQKKALLDALDGLGIAPNPPAPPAPKPLDPAELEKIVTPLIEGAINSHAASTQAGFDALSAVLQDIRDEANKSPRKKAKIKQGINKAMGGTKHWMTEVLATHCEPGNSDFPVQFAGGSGIGKTYQSERWAEQFDRSVFIGGTAALKFDEIIGWTMPMIDADGNHTVKWKDGLATSAFRCVALDENGDPGKGTLDNCMVIFDELNRLDLSIQGVLIPALNQVYHPVKKDVLCYRLVTGRLFDAGDPWAPDIPAAEVLYVPVEKLAIVATSNEGADYNTAEGDFAQQSRFIKERVFYRRSESEAIYEGVLSQQGYGDTHKHAAELCNLSEALTELKNVQGVLEHALSTRHITRAVIGAGNDWNEACKRLHRDIVNACAKLDANDQIDGLSAKAADDVVRRMLSFTPAKPTNKFGVNH